jgi:hypothetical protein
LHHLILAIFDPGPGVFVLDFGFPLLLIEQFDLVAIGGYRFLLFRDSQLAVGYKGPMLGNGIVKPRNLTVNGLQLDQLEYFLFQ